jgi:hypothetical protein
MFLCMTTDHDLIEPATIDLPQGKLAYRTAGPPRVTTRPSCSSTACSSMPDSGNP